MPQHEPKGEVRSLSKALELLDILHRSGAPMSLQHLSQASGYPKSTIYALLATLRRHGCIRQERDGRYALGVRLFEWGCGAAAAWKITDVARPYLERLAADAGSTAVLSYIDGGGIVVIDQQIGGSSIHIASEIGSHVPLHATSQGKLFLASLPDATVKLLLTGQGMPAFTPHTITDMTALFPELQRIRESGYAIENGEYKIGLRSVSAPVPDQSGALRYTLSVVGLFRRIDSQEFENAVARVSEAARQLSRAIGGSVS